MKQLFSFACIAVLSVGCSSSSTGSGGSGGGSAGAGGEGGAGGSAQKCDTPPALLRCATVNIAHRGGRRIRPEHTIEAYDQALVDGTDILELDVHETVDGEIVVMHDDTLDRTTDCDGLIKEKTFAEIRTCDAGYEFTTDGGETYPYRGMGIVVPTLQEVLERYPDTPFVIEIKQEEPSMVDHFVEVLEEYGVVDRTIGASFSDDVLIELRAAAPALATSLGFNEVVQFVLAYRAPTPPPDYVPPAEFLHVPTEQGGFDLRDERLMEFAHSFDMRVHYWTINDEEEMRSLIEDYGVDGIMTDLPPLLTEVITDLDAAPPN